MAYEALRHYAARDLACRFVSNVDGTDFAAAVRGLDPAETLFIVAPKTFTTQETMTNAAAAKRWIVSALGEGAVARHFVAATAKADEAARFGLPECNVFPFGEWIGGRYSLWSSVGLPIAIAIGMPAFERLLAGAHAADLEFRSAPPERNVPVLAALAAALIGLLGAGTASAATAPAAETRVGASTPATSNVVGVHESVSAGQRWGHAPPQAETVVATGVAAKTESRVLSKVDDLPCNCFVAGTTVQTSKGAKPIEGVRPGDQVWAKNRTTGKNELRPVTGLFQKKSTTLMTITLASGATVVTLEEIDQKAALKGCHGRLLGMFEGAGFAGG